MKKLIAIMLMLLSTAILVPLYAIEDVEEQPSKTELLDSKYSDGLYQYKLGCTTYFDANLQPEDHIFVFCAQNDKYQSIQDIFVIYSGSATEMYNALTMILNFSENFKEDGVKVPKDRFSLKNYKLPMFGWYTGISTDEGWHDFKTKDFKRMIKKLETFCKKNGITIEKTED